MTVKPAERIESSITLHISTLTFLGRIFGRVVSRVSAEEEILISDMRKVA